MVMMYISVEARKSGNKNEYIGNGKKGEEYGAPLFFLRFSFTIFSSFHCVFQRRMGRGVCMRGMLSQYEGHV